MNCKKIQQQIYLYDELSSKERMEVDKHVHHCETCLPLFQEMQQLKTTLHSFSQLKTKVKNPERLTRTIMKSIEEHSQPVRVNIINSLLDSLFTRYALGAMSLLMVILFIAEQQKDFNHDPIHFQAAKTAGNADVILNTGSFLKASEEGQKRETWKFTSLYACLKRPDCDNALIRNFKLKKSQHENI